MYKSTKLATINIIKKPVSLNATSLCWSRVIGVYSIVSVFPAYGSRSYSALILVSTMVVVADVTSSFTSCSTSLTLAFWDILELQCAFYAFTPLQSTKPSKIARAPNPRPSQVKVVFTQDKYKQRLQVVPNNWLQLCVSGQILWQEAQGLVAITYRLTQTCQIHNTQIQIHKYKA